MKYTYAERYKWHSDGHCLPENGDVITKYHMVE